eukprot:7859538-Ditylum_brightwellii.AAC.1
MGNNLGWKETQFSNVLFTTPRTPIMRRQVPENTLLFKNVDVSIHVAHELAGGVTDGQWTMGYPFTNSAMGQGVLSSIKRNYIKKSLCHILRFERGGRKVAPPDNSSQAAKGKKIQGALHQDALMSSLHPEEEVIAPGASATGWVRRHLLMQEIADAFDLASYIKPTSTRQLSLITNAASGKVLTIILG